MPGSHQNYNFPSNNQQEIEGTRDTQHLPVRALGLSPCESETHPNAETTPDFPAPRRNPGIRSPNWRESEQRKVILSSWILLWSTQSRTSWITNEMLMPKKMKANFLHFAPSFRGPLHNER